MNIANYPYANHGAGIFTYKTVFVGVNVGVHIPAPWFAYGSRIDDDSFSSHVTMHPTAEMGTPGEPT